MRGRNAAAEPTCVGGYVLERVLGTGGMAEVHVARRDGPHGFSKRVALKRILPQLAGDPRLVEMFCDEARIHAALSHPNLVQVFDFGEHDGLPYMAMEFVDGLSGAELIARVAARRRSVDTGPALYIVREVLDALAYVHSARDEEGRPLGIVHRDVAPSNILIGRVGQVKLGDFGIVRSAAIDARTVPGELKGKIGYVSPEQALGMPLDGRSDLFSVGIVLAELLLCKPLFTGSNELEILEGLHRGNLRMLDVHGRHIPSDVRAILHKALSRWPEQRFQTAQEFAAAIDAAARIHGASLGAHVLAEWLVDLGLVAISSDVQQKLPSTPAIRARLVSDYPFSENVTIDPLDADDVPPPSLSAALIELAPYRPGAPAELAHALEGSGPSVLGSPEVSYRVAQPDGQGAEPLGLARMLELVATGRLAPDAQVSRNFGPFLPAGSLFELSRLAARPAYRFHEHSELRAREHWAVTAEALPEIVLGLARARRTGLLVAQRAEEQVRIYFEDGTPAVAASTHASELLGALLVADGVLTAGELEEALEQGWRRGLRLGDALVEEGLVRPAVLLKAVMEQRRRRLVRLLSFRDGELWFVDGASHGEEVVPAGSGLKLCAHALLAAYGDAEIARLLAGVEAGGILERTSNAPTVVPALDLPTAEAQALASALRGRSLGALLAEGIRSWNFDVRAVRRAVFVGLVSGALCWRP